jgi:hypothetical protein
VGDRDLPGAGPARAAGGARRGPLHGRRLRAAGALAAGLPRLDDLAAERAALAELAQVAGDIERANAGTAERFSASAA